MEEIGDLWDDHIDITSKESTIKSYTPDTDDSLSILWICNDNTVNVPFTIVRAINKFTIHKAKLIQTYRTYLNWGNDSIMVSDVTTDEFLRMVETADVVHLNDLCVEGTFPFRGDLMFKDGGTVEDLRSLFTGEHRVFQQCNGTYYRKNYLKINKISDDHNMYLTCSTPDQCQHGSKLMWIPSPIPLWDRMYSLDVPVFDGENIKISHISPLERRKATHPLSANRLWKGTDVFLKVCKEGFPSVEVCLIEQVSHDECMKVRKDCQIHYDQFWGAYGLSALEGISTGQITIVGLSQVSRFIGGGGVFISPDSGSYNDMKTAIIKAIDTLCVPKSRTIHIQNARSWCEKWHSDDKVAKYLVSLYEHAGFWRK